MQGIVSGLGDSVWDWEIASRTVSCLGLETGTSKEIVYFGPLGPCRHGHDRHRVLLWSRRLWQEEGSDSVSGRHFVVDGGED